jgi:hypothetical protein
VQRRDVNLQEAIDIERITSVMENSMKFAAEINSGVSGTLDCTILKRKMNYLKDAVCMPGNFANQIATLSFYLVVMGPLLVMLGLCMCC